MSKAKPQEAAVASLKLHPDLARLPMLPEDHADFKALVASVAEEGRVWTPLVLDENDLVIDGRHRLEAAMRAGINTVPTVRVAGADASQQVFTGLLARRHLTDSARAWLALGYLKECAARGKVLRSNLPNTETATVAVTSGPTLSEALLALGVSEGNYQRARIAEKLLDGLSSKRKTLREKIEAGIINGDIALSRVASAIAGKEASEGGRAPTNYFETISGALTSLKNGFKNWKKLSAKQRNELYGEWSEVRKLIPEDWALDDLQEVEE